MVKPTIGQQGWGETLNAHLDTLLPTATASATYATRGTSATHALVRKLRTGTDGANITILGDSTANGADEWFQLAMVALGARFPAYNVTNRLWNDTAQAYDAATVLQTANTGGARNLYCSTSNGAYITAPDSAALSIVGDLEVQVKVLPSTWLPATVIDLCGKASAAPNGSWWIRLGTDGKLTFFWSADGTTNLQLTSNVSTSTVFADGTPGWIKVTFDVDNGAAGRTATFYTSPDGATWTILGVAQTSAGVTSIADTTAPVTFPGTNRSGFGTQISQPTAAYQLRIFNGINGTRVADCDLSLCVNAHTLFTDDKGVVWTPASVVTAGSGEMRGAPTLSLYNGSTSGMAIAYTNDATRFPKQTYQSSMDLAFINYSHNENLTTNYRAVYKQLADAIIAKWTDVGVVASTQNIQIAPRTSAQITAHASRMSTIRALAAAQRYSLVDAFDAFVRADPTGALLIVPADTGVHPNPTGSALWATECGYLFTA